MTIVSSELNEINDRQAVVDVIRATSQFRAVSFGKERKFQAVDVRRKAGKWQVLDSDEKWYSSFWCND